MAAVRAGIEGSGTSSVLATGVVQSAPPYEWGTLMRSMNLAMSDKEREEREKEWLFIPADAAKGTSLIGMTIMVKGQKFLIEKDSGPTASTLWRLREIKVKDSSTFAFKGQQYEFAILAPPSERISMDHLMHLRSNHGDKVTLPYDSCPRSPPEPFSWSAPARAAPVPL